MILCSPTPWTLASDMITLSLAHAGSVLSLYAHQYLRLAAKISMNGVPGVIELESNAFFVTVSRVSWLRLPPFCRLSNFKCSSLSSSFSFASWAARNRRERCGGGGARGAAPAGAGAAGQHEGGD